MKFLILFACLISFVAASGYYGHHIPARVDVAPGGVETIYTQKVIPQVVSVFRVFLRLSWVQLFWLIGALSEFSQFFN